MKINENMEWEKEAAFLAKLPRVTPYRVPEEYFNGLQSQINRAIFLADLEKADNQGFTVPSNYFEELGMHIESRIATASINSLVATDGFEVPSNYFEQLQQRIVAQTSGVAPKPKVFKLWQSEVMKYVSAACFIVLTASGLYLNQQHTVNQIAKTELANDQLLYDIDETVIFDHLEETQNASSTSDVEMENYILEHFSSIDLSNNL